MKGCILPFPKKGDLGLAKNYRDITFTSIAAKIYNALQAILLFVDFTKTFDSIHRGKMEQILQAYGLPKETLAAITILYRNTKVKVRLPDRDTKYFDIVAGVLQGDTLASSPIPLYHLSRFRVYNID